jgi:hypothetical protein
VGIEAPAPDGRRAGSAVSARALSPQAALAWLRSLSVDLRASAVLGADGAVLAGDAELAARVAGPLEAAPAEVTEVRAGDVLAVRSARHTVVVALGPQALERLARADVRAALDALDGR